jgi:hypothetical protein
MNPYRKLKSLLPDPPLLVGTVIAYGNGTATVELPGGGTVKARGEAAVSDKVFVRDGAIEGPAPSLPVEIIEV